MNKLVRIQWPHYAAMIRASSTLTARLAIRTIIALSAIAITRVIRTVKRWDAIKVVAKATWRDIDQLSWVEIVAPGVIVNPLARWLCWCRMYRWLCWLWPGRRCRFRSRNRRWFLRWCNSWCVGRRDLVDGGCCHRRRWRIGCGNAC
jgi:hypothetical protein